MKREDQLPCQQYTHILMCRKSMVSNHKLLPYDVLCLLTLK